MSLLKSIIKMELLTYRRNLFIYFTVTILSAYVLIGYYHYLRSDFIEAGTMLQSSSYINMAASLFGLFFGAIMAGSEEKAHFREALSSMPGDTLRPMGKIIAWFIVSGIITLIAYFEILILFKIAGSEFILFKKEILLYIIIFWGAVLFCTGILGYFIEIIIPLKWLSITLIFLTWVLISPFNNLFSFVFPKHVLTLMNIGEDKIVSAYDDFQGLNISASYFANIAMFFFLSMSLLSAGLCVKKFNELTKAEKSMHAGAAAIAFLLFCYLIEPSLKPIDKTAFDSYRQLYSTEDADYYSRQNPGNYMPYIAENNDINRSITVGSYNFNIAFDENNLYYVAEIEIENSGSIKIIPFTLYHGLNVNSVNVNNKPLHFTRQDDLIYIEWPDNISAGNIIFDISGNTGSLCPITDNSFFLFSSFPWYPIPGKWIVAENILNFYEPDFNKIELFRPAEFHIRINSDYEVSSNLNRIGNNEFYGLSKGVSLFRSMLITKHIDGTEYIVPPDRSAIIHSSVPPVEEKISYIASIIGRPETAVPGKIIVKPLYTYFPKDNLIYTEDCLYVSNNLSGFSSLDRIEGVFRAFYWNNKYNYADNTHAHIFELLFRLITEPDSSNDLTDYAALEESQHENSGENIFLTSLSKEVLGLYDENPDYVKRLIKIMYDKIEDHPEASLSEWLNTIEEIKAGDYNV